MIFRDLTGCKKGRKKKMERVGGEGKLKEDCTVMEFDSGGVGS